MARRRAAVRGKWLMSYKAAGALGSFLRGLGRNVSVPGAEANKSYWSLKRPLETKVAERKIGRNR